MEAALVARLEKAVQRLEALGVNPTERPPIAICGPPGAPRAPASTPAPGGGAAGGGLSEWDQLLAEHLAPVTALSQHLPAEAQAAAAAFTKAFQLARRVVEVSAIAKAPSPSELQPLLAPVAAAMGDVGAASEAGRRSAASHQLRVMAESVGALGFLAYTGPGSGMSMPRQHVAENWQSSEFYANKVLMEARGKDENIVSWVKGVKALMQQLEQVVGRAFPTGLRWAPDGQPLAEAMAAAPGAAPAAAAAAAAPAAAAPAPAAPAPAAPAPAPRRAGPPPPPPPGPPPKPLTPEQLGTAGAGESSSGRAGGGGGADMSALFAELSKGEGITGGLKKVTDDMKTKNRADRSGTVPAASSASAAAAPAAAGASRAGSKGPSGPPKLELVDRKWVVEFHKGRQDLVVTNEHPKNSVYVYGCEDCVLQIVGKVNAVSLDRCSRVGVVIGDVIAVVEAVNCSGIQLQVTGSVPTLSVEKTDGAQLFVSKKCAGDPNFQVVTAKCSALNVVVVAVEGEEGFGEEDPAEHPVPEQFISTFAGGKLVTVAAAHSSA